jgi:MFS family permease
MIDHCALLRLLIHVYSEWNKIPDEINHATAGNVFMLGAGGIFVVWFSAYFGRLPVLLLFQSLNLATSAWSGSATNFESFMAARILHGFFATVAAAVRGPISCITLIIALTLAPGWLDVYQRHVLLPSTSVSPDLQ